MITSVVKRPILCFPIESWETIYMLFMLPGLVIWVVGAIWCFRRNNIQGAVLLQVLGALEIAIGGITAFITAMKNMASDSYKAGGYDIISDIAYYGEIPIIGLITHFVLLAITLTLLIRVKKARKSDTIST